MNRPPFLIFTVVFLLLNFVAFSSFSDSNEIISNSIQDFTFGLVQLSFGASVPISVNDAPASYTNDQGIIPASKAKHLDSDRKFVADVFDEIKERDGNVVNVHLREGTSTTLP